MDEPQNCCVNRVWDALTLTDIVDVVIGEKGPRSDSKLFEETQAELPETLEFIGDKAYVGSRNTTTPIKKPRGGELTQDQKDFNRNVSQKGSMSPFSGEKRDLYDDEVGVAHGVPV